MDADWIIQYNWRTEGEDSLRDERTAPAQDQLCLRHSRFGRVHWFRAVTYVLGAVEHAEGQSRKEVT